MPPPPPPPGALPKVKPVPLGKLGGGSPTDNRGDLLKSIQKGTKLKKAVTVDKSGPLIAGKVSGGGSSAGSTATSSPSRGPPQSSSQPSRSAGPMNFQDELANRLKKSSNSNNNTINRNEDRPREVIF